MPPEVQTGSIHDQAAAILQQAAAARASATEEVETTEEAEEPEVEEIESEEVEEAEEEEATEASDEESEEESGPVDEVVEIDPAIMATALGVNESDLVLSGEGELFIKVKVDGKTDHLPLEKIRRDYQIRKSVDDKAASLKEEQSKFQAEMQNRQEYLNNALAHVDSVLQQDEIALLDEYNAIDWDSVRANNPGESAALKQEYNERFQRLQVNRAKVQSDREIAHKEQMEKRQVQFAEYVEKEQEQLLEALPQWSDKKIAKKESTALQAYAAECGFDDKEVENITDHRSWLLLRKAWLYDQSIGKTKANLKKVKTIPKIAKVKAPADQSKVAQKKLDTSREVAKKGDIRSKTSFVSRLINPT